MTLELPQHLEEWIQAQVQSGKYANPVEVIQNTLETALRQAQAQAALETMLDRGFADVGSGKTHRFETLEDFRAAVQARVQTA